MSDDVLDNLIQKYIKYSPEHLTFCWHGGEPMIAGLPFYKKVVRKIALFGGPKVSTYHLMQTNGSLMTDEFAKFFKKNNFYVGVSIDGPEKFHSKQRFLNNGKSSFPLAMGAVKTLRKNGIEPGIICTITKKNYKHAKEILDFFVTNKLFALSFSPVAYVDRRKKDGDDLVLSSNDWFEFLRDLYYAWLGYNDSHIQIREINEIIAWRLGKPLNLCFSGKACLHWFSVSPFGDVSACEYYNYDEVFGNITQSTFPRIFQGQQFKDFKKAQLFVNPLCKECEFYNLCGNGCSRLRRMGNSFDPKGVNMYCKQRKSLYYEINNSFNKIKTGKEVTGDGKEKRS